MSMCCRRTDIADALQRGAPTPADIARVAKAVYASPMNIQVISSCQPFVDTSSATDGLRGSQAHMLLYLHAALLLLMITHLTGTSCSEQCRMSAYQQAKPLRVSTVELLLLTTS